MKKMRSALVLAVVLISAQLSHANNNVVAAIDTNAVENTAMTSQQELIDLFFAAAKIGQLEVIEEFLKHGFPVDVRNAQGYTALIMAAYYGQQATVTTLLNHGADRCARDNKGNTALMGAMFKLEWSIVKQLRKVDCDVGAAKTGQKTVAEFAKVLGQEQQLQQLQD